MKIQEEQYIKNKQYILQERKEREAYVIVSDNFSDSFRYLVPQIQLLAIAKLELWMEKKKMANRWAKTVHKSDSFSNTNFISSSENKSGMFIALRNKFMKFI